MSDSKIQNGATKATRALSPDLSVTAPNVRRRPTGDEQFEIRSSFVGINANSVTRLTRLLKGVAHRYWPSVVHAFADSTVWVFAIPLTIITRLDFSPASFEGLHWVRLTGVAIAFQIIAGLLTGVYRRRWRVATFDEIAALAAAIISAGALSFVVVFFTRWTPRSVPILATPLVVLSCVSARSLWRVYRQRRLLPHAAVPVVVVGAGEAAYQLVRSLLEDPAAEYRPVALVDDDPAKASLRWRTARVMGPIDDLSQVAKATGSSTALLAIPSGSEDLYRRVDLVCRDTGLDLLVVPRLGEILSNPTAGDIRPLEIEDLLGRPSKSVDLQTAGAYVSGRRVLVTGAGGSIGSELCRQLAQLNPSELMMLDRDEGGLHATQLSIEGHGLLDNPNLILADIRDVDRIKSLFSDRKPEIVFHAAALKHLSLLERFPEEGWKTNVMGTKTLLDAALASGCERFINVSTDKAADPSSVLGYTKRAGELLTAAIGDQASMLCSSVRFGNVLASRGSMLPAFERQAASGGPITVTHPEVTRYFMTIQEAVTLTIVAGSSPTGREITVLNMGEPIRIADVARSVAKRYSPEPNIVFTSLRPGEKLHEVLVGQRETVIENGDFFVRVVVTDDDLSHLNDFAATISRNISDQLLAGPQADRICPSSPKTTSDFSQK